MLFNEPKLLKSRPPVARSGGRWRFSALQRAEIAEMLMLRTNAAELALRFSALQRAEIAEITIWSM